jgi:pyridinium-3,5-biscarboxylic acid mononucleotide sulfurtransferase
LYTAGLYREGFFLMAGKDKKILKLREILRRMQRVLIAYSGGADSTLLLKVARDTLGDKVLAVSADSLSYPSRELAAAKKMARLLGARHKILKTAEFQDRRFVSNPKERCYFCKRELFTKLKKIAASRGIDFVLDGSILSDRSDFRPGAQAKKELGIRSPLEEAGFTKDDVRRQSKRFGLSTWDKPAQACLASRVPYGTELRPAILKRIQEAEGYLSKIGFRQSRVRHYNGLCRIEVLKSDMPKLIGKSSLIAGRLKKLGYNYITVDLEGYRTGSINEVMR